LLTASLLTRNGLVYSARCELCRRSCLTSERGKKAFGRLFPPLLSPQECGEPPSTARVQRAHSDRARCASTKGWPSPFCPCRFGRYGRLSPADPLLLSHPARSENRANSFSCWDQPHFVEQAVRRAYCRSTRHHERLFAFRVPAPWDSGPAPFCNSSGRTNRLSIQPHCQTFDRHRKG
jgi:hypothetical protein